MQSISYFQFIVAQLKSVFQMLINALDSWLKYTSTTHTKAFPKNSLAAGKTQFTHPDKIQAVLLALLTR